MHSRQITPNNLPVPVEALLSLFEVLGAEIDRHGCDNTLQGTIAWLIHHGYDVLAVTQWLRRRGGYCDCEVLSNVEPKVCGDD
jgi:hypothetical protein